MDKRRYTITLHGCDAETIFDMDLTEEEKELLSRLAKLSEETSTFMCMPVMQVELSKAPENN